MGLGDRLAQLASSASLNNNKNKHTAEANGWNSKATEQRREELAERAAEAADWLKKEGH